MDDTGHIYNCKCMCVVIWSIVSCPFEPIRLPCKIQQRNGYRQVRAHTMLYAQTHIRINLGSRAIPFGHPPPVGCKEAEPIAIAGGPFIETSIWKSTTELCVNYENMVKTGGEKWLWSPFFRRMYFVEVRSESNTTIAVHVLNDIHICTNLY